MRRSPALLALFLTVAACGDSDGQLGFTALDSAGFTQAPTAGTQFRPTVASLDPLGSVDVREVGETDAVTIAPINVLNGSAFQADLPGLAPAIPLGQSFVFGGDILERPVLAGDLVRLASLAGDASLVTTDPALLPLDFTRFGVWSQAVATGAPLGPGATLAFGFETPAGGVPLLDAAMFVGRTVGRLDQAALAGGTISRDLVGDARLAVDFGAGSVLGEFTNLRALEVGATSAAGVIEPLLGFTATASVAGSGFTGTTQATGLTGLTPEPMQGDIAGSFMGPAAEEVGGVWSLRGETASAVGSFGARR